MELLQKFTLYDLLGYMLPGGTVLYVIYGREQCTDIPALNLIAFLTFSYLTGIVISELMEDIFAISRKIKYRVTYTTESGQKDFYKELGIPRELLENVLRQRKLLESGEVLEDNVIPFKYLWHMYSDIQTDSKYNRIHNYASAEVMSKNFALASVTCMVVCLCRGEFIYIPIFMIGAIVLLIRKSRFRKKKIGYTVHWFVDKVYAGNSQMQ